MSFLGYKGFLLFSGGIKWEYWPEMSLSQKYKKWAKYTLSYQYRH